MKSPLKTTIVLFAVCKFLPQITNAEVLVKAVDVDATITGSNDSRSFNTGKFWYYRVRGYYARLDMTNENTSGSINVNVNGLGLKSLSVSSSGDHYSTGDVFMELNKLTEIRDKNVSVNVSVRSSDLSPMGYVSVFSEYLREPPVPVGFLDTPAIVYRDMQPNIGWNIDRVPPSLKIYNTGFLANAPSAVYQGGLAGGASSVGDSSSNTGAADGSTSGDGGKSNNGHGNNADGVDVSNPGKAPWRWNDPSGEVDDESRGGGAAPSRRR